MSWWWIALAGASPPDLRPAAAPANAVELYREGNPTASSDLACESWLPHVALCFRVWEGKQRRWVTEADLAAWKTDRAALKRAVVARAREVMSNEPHEVAIADMSATYWTLLDGDGWAVAPFLHPDLLAKRMGVDADASIRAALPRVGVFLAWVPGSTELDTVMAVGVREHYDPASDAVTPTVYRWTGEAWVPFATARPTEGEGKTDGR